MKAFDLNKMQLPANFVLQKRRNNVYIVLSLSFLQVSHYISSLVFGGEDAQALSVIDKPLYTLLATSEAPKGLLNYTKSQFEDSKTLMDIDTAFLISVIDAIRYRSVSSNVGQCHQLQVRQKIKVNVGHSLKCCQCKEVSE